MPDWQLTTPVAVFVFNRPDTTRRVFEEIRRAKPPKLLVVADGPRVDRADDAEKCASTRKIIEQVDWDCEVLTNYSRVNLGCKQRVSSGLNWVFGEVDEAIILEDDCLPHPTFFRFCEELLAHYRNDERVMAISGDNFQFGRKRTQYSYYFSHYPHIWGWATWRRAWRLYDVDMTLWPAFKAGGWLRDLLMSDRAAECWMRIFQSVYDGRIDTWDFQWTFASWVHGGLSILPNINLVCNIGFDGTATHTAQAGRIANIPTQEMEFPLSHPLFMLTDRQADAFTQKSHYESGRLARATQKSKRALRRVVNAVKTKSAP